MIELSLCMIVKNEEDTLGNCLESVKDLVDEIVVVDTGSTDNTKEIALKYGAKVFDFEWIDDFSAARNFSFSKASCDYIMWLDADDIMKEKDRILFRELKKQISPDVDVIHLQYNTAFDKDGNTTFTYQRERIVKKSKNFKWSEPIHECLITGGNKIAWDVAITHNKIHKGFCDRNLKIYEGLIEKGKILSPRGMYYFARELRTHGRVSEATQYFEQFLATGVGWKEDCICSCFELSYLYDAKLQRTQIYEILYRSFLYDLPRGEISCRLGELYREDEDYTRSIYWYKVACETEIPEAIGFIQPDYYNFIPLTWLSFLYDRVGMLDKAIQYHEKAKKLKPDHPSIIYNENYFTNKLAATN